LPNPRQIGRIVERINAVGTIRLCALKDWSAIKESDGPIRMLGQELDKVTGDWSERRDLVEELKSFRRLDYARSSARYKAIANGFRRISIPGPVGRGLRYLWKVITMIILPGQGRWVVRDEQDNSLQDAKYALLHFVSTGIERRPIGLGARLTTRARLRLAACTTASIARATTCANSACC
jgi:hypothetical protein